MNHPHLSAFKDQVVVVGLSGGVDSSVSALLLKQAGAHVIGVFMKNWTDNSVLKNDECTWIDDSNDAMLVAEKLDIPFQVLDLSKEYKAQIVDYMFAEYEKGRTPNPDVLCNREIKFDVFLKAAQQLGAQYVATGHYCRKESPGNEGRSGGYHRLLSGIDPNKDQSYFLCQITQEALQHIVFPIGHLLKSQVRALAEEAGLITAQKKDSQGLCFIGKVRLPEFLQRRLQPQKGPIIEIPSDYSLYPSHSTSESYENNPVEFLHKYCVRPHFSPQMGTQIGEHNGAHFYTVGQRKGLQIGGKPLPSFVLGTDTQSNTIYVGQGANHPGLWSRGLFCSQNESAFIRPDLVPKPGASIQVLARIRYRQPLFKATLYSQPNGYFLVFNEPQSSVAPGQFAAWYLEDELIGSGTISHLTAF